MLRLFALTTVLLTCADHWTTYLCLHAPVEGWRVAEANPVADWLFARVGLGGGLLIDTLLTLGAVGFLMTTRSFGHRVKLTILLSITLATGYAVANNLGAISRMGIAPWSGLV